MCIYIHIYIYNYIQYLTTHVCMYIYFKLYIYKNICVYMLCCKFKISSVWWSNANEKHISQVTSHFENINITWLLGKIHQIYRTCFLRSHVCSFMLFLYVSLYLFTFQFCWWRLVNLFFGLFKSKVSFLKICKYKFHQISVANSLFHSMPYLNRVRKNKCLATGAYPHTSQFWEGIV